MSTTWTDAIGREWTARIAIADVTRVKECGFDLMDAQSLPKLFENPLRVVELIVLVHQSQWQGSMTADDFAELAVANEVVASKAVTALQAALSDFLRRLGRPAMAELVETSMRAQEKAQRAALEKVRDPRVEQVIDRETSKALAKIDAELEKACS